MPFYEYRCVACGQVFEKMKSVQQREEPEPCPDCGAESIRKISAPGLMFKGSGWYVNDYSGKQGSGKANAGTEKSAEGTAAPAKSSDAPAAGSTSAAEAGSGASRQTHSGQSINKETKTG